MLFSHSALSLAHFVLNHQAGVGMTALQLPFDFRFAWSGAKFTFPFVRRGIVPEGTSFYYYYYPLPIMKSFDSPQQLLASFCLGSLVLHVQTRFC